MLALYWQDRQYLITNKYAMNMKKLITIIIMALGFSLNGFSQSPGNSAYGHSHKKYKAKTYYPARRYPVRVRTNHPVVHTVPVPAGTVVTTTKYKTHPARVTPVRTGNGHNKHN